MLYSAGQNIFKVEGKHDPDSVRDMEIICRPQTWTANTVYLKQNSSNYDVVIPSTFKGIYYKVDNPGKSGPTEPDWAKVVGDITDDFETGETEGLTWKAVAYNLMPLSETVSSVVFTATNDVTVSSESATGTSLLFTIDAIASDADARTQKKFQVKGHGVKSNGEEFDVTLEFKLAEK